MTKQKIISMKNDIEKVIARRQTAYDRAVRKTQSAEAKVRAYEKKNDGFASMYLTDLLDKAQDAESKAFAALSKAESYHK